MVNSSGSLWLEWDSWAGVKGYFTTKKINLSGFYNIVLDDPSEKNIAYLSQTHSDRICYVSSAGEYDGDGLVSDSHDLILRVKVADCLAVYIYDPIKSIISLLHAGRKGTEKKILKKAIREIRKRFDCIPSDLSILIGPSICPRCYDVDLWAENVNQARSIGVTNIINPRICTYEDPGLFYSYRKDRCQERMHALFRFL